MEEPMTHQFNTGAFEQAQAFQRSRVVLSQPQSLSFWQRAWRKLRANRAAMTSLVVLGGGGAVIASVLLDRLFGCPMIPMRKISMPQT